jgi:hypothetical protein
MSTVQLSAFETEQGLMPDAEGMTDAPDAGDTGFPDPEVPEQFAVSDRDSANWVVRKINEARAYRKAVAVYAAREMKRAEREEEFFLFRFEGQLRAWAVSEIVKLKGRRKTINLPAGSLAFRTDGPKLVIDDDEKVIEWARGNCPEAVQISERLSRGVVKEHFEATGEVPKQGTHFEPEAERFFIR